MNLLPQSTSKSSKLQDPETCLQEVPQEEANNEEITGIGIFILQNTPDNFVAGKTRLFINNWQKITSDKWILQTISGYHVHGTL